MMQLTVSLLFSVMGGHVAVNKLHKSSQALSYMIESALWSSKAVSQAAVPINYWMHHALSKYGFKVFIYLQVLHQRTEITSARNGLNCWVFFSIFLMLAIFLHEWKAVAKPYLFILCYVDFTTKGLQEINLQGGKEDLNYPITNNTWLACHNH